MAAVGEASEVFGNQVSFVKSLNLGLELVQRAGQMDRRERRAGEKDFRYHRLRTRWHQESAVPSSVHTIDTPNKTRLCSYIKSRLSSKSADSGDNGDTAPRIR